MRESEVEVEEEKERRRLFAGDDAAALEQNKLSHSHQGLFHARLLRLGVLCRLPRHAWCVSGGEREAVAGEREAEQERRRKRATSLGFFERSRFVFFSFHFFF